MYMLQNPSQPPLIKGGARRKQSQNSVTKNATKSPHDKGDRGGFETKKDLGDLYKMVYLIYY